MMTSRMRARTRRTMLSAPIRMGWPLTVPLDLIDYAQLLAATELSNHRLGRDGELLADAFLFELSAADSVASTPGSQMVLSWRRTVIIGDGIRVDDRDVNIRQSWSQLQVIASSPGMLP
jgi:hypothetical protein